MKRVHASLYISRKASTRKLTVADLKAAANLKRIWTRERALGKFTNQSATLQLGWKSSSAIYPYLNGRIPLNISVTLRFAKLLGVHPYEIRPDLDIPYSLVPEPD